MAMKTLPYMIVVLVTISALASNHVYGDESPFLIDKKEFGNRITRVAVAPLNVVAYFELSDAVTRQLEEETMRLLAKKKFEVVPVDVYRTIRDTMSDRVGGIRTSTGDYDAMRVAAVWDHSKREMLLRHPVDAILTVSVMMVDAQFKNDRAEWDGVKQKVESKGRGKFGGNIRAASMRASIIDRQDKLLFSSSGGIEVLQDRVDAQLIPRPKEAMLKDEKRLMKALEIALDPL